MKQNVNLRPTVAVTSIAATAAWIALSHPALAQAAGGGIDFSKADSVGNSLLSWFRGNLATFVFTLGIIVTGFLAAFNRISWFWPGAIIIGAFLVFGAPALVGALRTMLS